MISRILGFFQGFFQRENYTLRNFAAFLIVAIGIQYGSLEGLSGVSPVKVAIMALCPFVLITHFVPNRAFEWDAVYYIWLIFTALILHPLTFRASTVIYAGMFMTMFVTFYTLVWDYHVFSIQFFIQFLRTFIFATVGVLLIQQACLIFGIHYFPLVNLHYFLNRDLGANSLFNEPSQYARVLSVLYYAYLKCNEYLGGEKISITEIYKGEYLWVTLAFLWAMFTMGSGTAFVCLAILSLYFLKGRYIIIAIPLFVVAIWGLEKMGNSSFSRAQVAMEVSATGNTELVRQTDNSAGARIIPMINTLKIDLSKTDSWIGEGCDAAQIKGFYDSTRYMGEINNYGLIAYILGLILIFQCAINFKSLATLMYFLGVGGGTGNIAYGWCILMIFSVVKYFHDNRDEEFIYEENESINIEDSSAVV